MLLLATKNRGVYRIFKIERQQRVFFKFLIKNGVLGVKRVKNKSQLKNLVEINWRIVIKNLCIYDKK